MREPVRNLLVYGDGRVEEVSFRLSGRIYYQTEDLGDGRIRERRFEADYATDTTGPDDGDRAYTMVYVEHGSGVDPVTERVEVNTAPVRVVVPMSERKSVAEAHRACMSSGGHEQHPLKDACQRCGLSGYVIRSETFRVQAEEEERRSNAGLRDELVRLRDENRTLKVENCDLRRTLERAQRTPQDRDPR